MYALKQRALHQHVHQVFLELACAMTAHPALFSFCEDSLLVEDDCITELIKNIFIKRSSRARAKLQEEWHAKRLQRKKNELYLGATFVEDVRRSIGEMEFLCKKYRIIFLPISGNSSAFFSSDSFSSDSAVAEFSLSNACC